MIEDRDIRKNNIDKRRAIFVHIDADLQGAVTLGNFSCNLPRNFVATQVA